MINKIVLGTVQLGLDYGVNNTKGKPSLNQAFDILNTAYDNGIKLLDTAEAYGNSQEVIGLFHKKFPTKKFNIISKINPLQLNKTTDIEKRIYNNLTVLGIKQLYTYMFHHYQSLKDNNDIYLKLIQLKKEGLIKKIGVSLYTNQELEDILENYPVFDIVQLPFNLFDNASKRKEILEQAKKRGIEIHVRSVFLQGVFFISLDKLPSKLADLKSPISKILDLSQQTKIALNSLALKYVLEKEYIDHVLIGVDSSEQLLENISVINYKEQIPHQKIDAINIKKETLLNPANWK
jgi:aryl-alcohol dehydrogenase-like predicted oxidoreductase